MNQIYNQQRFCEIYPAVNDFLADFERMSSDTTRSILGIPVKLTDADLMTTYYLIFSRFGNTAINTNFDLARWKMNLQTIIYSYGPEYFKKMEIQDNIRNLTLSDLQTGAKTIMNTAMNPEVEPSTASLEELNYINQQNTSNSKLSQVDAYGLQWDMMHSRLTEEFIAKFKPLFSKFTLRDKPLWLYEEEDE
jgi:hypothetical protein